MISLLRFSSIVSGILFFSCVCRGNAITHLASKDHLKNLKHFLWKYGGGMDKLDSFRITESELAKVIDYLTEKLVLLASVLNMFFDFISIAFCLLMFFLLPSFN